MGEMPQGVIKKLVADRGFGFISAEDGTDIFFHNSAVADDGFEQLQQNQNVEYEVDEGDGHSGKGPRASMVQPL
jgi:CspA family cold shock protein